MAKAREALVAKGAELVEVNFAGNMRGDPDIVATKASSTYRALMELHYGHRSDDVEDLWSAIRAAKSWCRGETPHLLGSYVLSADCDTYYKKTIPVRALIMKDFAAAFAQCDMILGPTSPTVAFKRGEKASTQHVHVRHLSGSANLAGSALRFAWL